MKPRCFDRPPSQPTTTRYGIDSTTGLPIRVWISSTWSVDRCTQRDGAGIGPNGENFADAHGFDCSGCRWLPMEFA